jgi:hypothetical protein
MGGRNSTFSKWRPVEIFQCRESISNHISNFDDIGQSWIFAVLWWPFWKWRLRKISSGRHIQDGCHNTAQIQHCSISTEFHMWVDYDDLNRFRTSKNFYRSPFLKMNRTMLNLCGIMWPFWKWRLLEIFQCRDIIIYPHMKCGVPEKCRFCRIGRQKYVKFDKNWFFVGPPNR